MGEISEMLLDGTMDPETGEFNFDGEDGPGFPMTGAQADEFKRAMGWPGDRGASRVGQKIDGWWLELAEWIGTGTVMVAGMTQFTGRADFPKQLRLMVNAGVLYQIRDEQYALSNRTRRQIGLPDRRRNA